MTRKQPDYIETTKKSVRKNINFSPVEYQEALAEARRRGLKFSDFVRRCISESIQRSQQ